MADENIDLTFLGRQVQKLQVDVRELQVDVRDIASRQSRLQGDVRALEIRVEAGFEAVDQRFHRLETEMRNGFAAVDNRFVSIEARLDRMNEQSGLNMQILLAAIKK